MPAFDGTGPDGQGAGTGRGRGRCVSVPQLDLGKVHQAQKDPWKKTFWAGLATIAAQYAVSYWLGRRSGGGRGGRWR